jgi:hypothetical protein
MSQLVLQLFPIDIPHSQTLLVPQEHNEKKIGLPVALRASRILL